MQENKFLQLNSMIGYGVFGAWLLLNWLRTFPAAFINLAQPTTTLYFIALVLQFEP